MAQDMNYSTFPLDLEPFDCDEIKATFNGVEYTAQKRDNGGMYSYGAEMINESTLDFSEYPFMIFCDTTDTFVGIDCSFEQELPFTLSIIGKQNGTPAEWAKVGGGAEPEGELLYETTITYWTSDDGFYYTDVEDMPSLPQTIDVIWNGTMYRCAKVNGEYGAPWVNDEPDWSEYPFNIYQESEMCSIAAQTDDPAEIKIYGIAEPEPPKTKVVAYDGTFTATVSSDNAYYYTANDDITNFDYLMVDSVIVTFDDNEYTLTDKWSDDEWVYEFGAFYDYDHSDWFFDEYPICIELNRDRGWVRFYVADTNSHTLKIESYV